MIWQGNCNMEFADVANNLKDESIRYGALTEYTSSEDKLFFSCWAHLDRKVQARNNQRKRIKIGRSLALCKKYQGPPCQEYAGYCRTKNIGIRQTLMEGRWPGRHCDDIFSLSNP